LFVVDNFFETKHQQTLLKTYSVVHT